MAERGGERALLQREPSQGLGAAATVIELSVWWGGCAQMLPLEGHSLHTMDLSEWAQCKDPGVVSAGVCLAQMS